MTRAVEREGQSKDHPLAPDFPTIRLVENSLKFILQDCCFPSDYQHLLRGRKVIASKSEIKCLC